MTDFSKDVKIFKALCDTKRLTILDYLKSGEKCACVLIENMNIGQDVYKRQDIWSKRRGRQGAKNLRVG